MKIDVKELNIDNYVEYMDLESIINESSGDLFINEYTGAMGSTNTSPYHNLVLNNMDKLERVSEIFNVNLEDVQYVFETGRETVLSNDIWNELQNSDSYSVKDLEGAIKFAQERKVDPKPYIDAIKQNEELPLPMVLNYTNGTKYFLVKGDVELALYRGLKVTPIVLLANLDAKLKEQEDKEQELADKDEAKYNYKKLSEKQISVIREFVKYCFKRLKLSDLPQQLTLSYKESEAKSNRSLGYFDPEKNKLWVYVRGRLLADILRTLGHEFVHRKQEEQGRITVGSGETGSEIENEANAIAGVLLRDFGKHHPEIYSTLTEVQKKPLDELGNNITNIYPWTCKNSTRTQYEFRSDENQYSVTFMDEGGGAFERMYFPAKTKSGTKTDEGKALKVNATVMSITLDFLKTNRDWFILTIHPIDPRRLHLVKAFLDKNLPNNYIVEEVEGVLNITRKTH